MSDTESPNFVVPKTTISEITSCSPNLLFVDCRPQSSFDQGHVKNAVSLSFPAILWRRILKQKERPGCLDEFLMGDSQELKKRHENDVQLLLYDENTRDISDCPLGSTLRTICEMFLLEPCTRFSYLEGGFQVISSRRSEWIVATPPPPLLFPTPPVLSTTKPCAANNLFQPASFIWGFLAIGSEENARDLAFLDRENISYILNLTPSECRPEVLASRTCLQIALLDNSKQDLLPVIPKAIDFIDTARVNNRRILVHCLAGVSRSTAIVLAYIMWHGHKSLGDAFDLVRTHRPIASPNLNFMGQLMVFGKCLCCKSSTTSTPAQAALLASVCLRKPVRRPRSTAPPLPPTPITSN